LIRKVNIYVDLETLTFMGGVIRVEYTCPRWESNLGSITINWSLRKPEIVTAKGTISDLRKREVDRQYRRPWRIKQFWFGFDTCSPTEIITGYTE